MRFTEPPSANDLLFFVPTKIRFKLRSVFSFLPRVDSGSFLISCNPLFVWSRLHHSFMGGEVRWCRTGVFLHIFVPVLLRVCEWASPFSLVEDLPRSGLPLGVVLFLEIFFFVARRSLPSVFPQTDPFWRSPHDCKASLLFSLQTLAEIMVSSLGSSRLLFFFFFLKWKDNLEDPPFFVTRSDISLLSSGKNGGRYLG